MFGFVTRALGGAAIVAFAVAIPAQAQANLQSNLATVALTATKSSTLTVSPAASTASLASITDNSTANNFTPVSVTTNWNLTSGTSVNLVGWFGTPAQALANGTNFIPSTRVQGRVGAAAFAAFDDAGIGATGVAGGSLVLFTEAVGAGTLLGNRVDQLDLRLDLTGATTVAGNYTGTLNLQAIVQ
jgi:hypothetical protein